MPLRRHTGQYLIAEVQERVSKRAVHLLVLNGMGKADAKARIFNLTEY